MKVEKVMSKKLITLKPDYSMKKAAKILYAKRVSGAPVVNDAGKIVGILSEKDVFQALYPSFAEYAECPSCHRDFEAMEKRVVDLEKKTVRQFMNRDVVVADVGDPIMKVGSLMLVKRFNRVPVVRDKKMVGLVSRREIYHNIFKEQLQIK